MKSQKESITDVNRPRAKSGRTDIGGTGRDRKKGKSTDADARRAPEDTSGLRKGTPESDVRWGSTEITRPDSPTGETLYGMRKGDYNVAEE